MLPFCRSAHLPEFSDHHVTFFLRDELAGADRIDQDLELRLGPFPVQVFVIRSDSVHFVDVNIVSGPDQRSNIIPERRSGYTFSPFSEHGPDIGCRYGFSFVAVFPQVFQQNDDPFFRIHITILMPYFVPLHVFYHSHETGSIENTEPRKYLFQVLRGQFVNIVIL